MKKVFLCLVVALIIPGMLFAVELSDKSKREIQTTASMIKGIGDSSTKAMMLSQSQESAAVPFICNLLLGCGIGSFIQGDTTGGTVALAGDALSLLIYLAGTNAAANAIVEADYYGVPYNGEGTGAMTFGLITLIGLRVYELIRPFTYNKEYNRQLNSACGNWSYAVVPSFDSNMNANVTLSAKISF